MKLISQYWTNIFFQKYLKNTSWLMIERVFRITINLVLSIYVACYLGPFQYGAMNYVLSIIFFVSFLNAIPHDFIVIRDLVNKKTPQGCVLGTGFVLKCIGNGLAFTLLMWWAIFFERGSLNFELLLILSLSVLFQSFSIIDLYFQSNVQSRNVVIVQYAQLIVVSFLKIFLMSVQAPILWFACILVFESMLLAVGLIWMFYREDKKIKFNFDPSLCINFLKESFPLIAATLALVVYRRFDQMIISHVEGLNAVGRYALAVNFCETIYFVPMLLTASLFPAIVSSKTMGEEVYRHRLQHLYDLLTMLSLLIVALMLLFVLFFGKIIFGPDFLITSTLVSIYIFSFPFLCWIILSDKCLVNENQMGIFFIRTLVAMLVNIYLNLLLVPIYGNIGAAIAMVVTVMISALFVFLFKNTRFMVWQMFSSFWPFKRRFLGFLSEQPIELKKH